MARSISTIKQQMIDEKNKQSALNGLTSPSMTAIWNLIFYVCAVAINILEQITDAFKTDIDTIVANGVPNTPMWVRDRVFKFQYNATNPQVLVVTDLVPNYPTINTACQIVTRCSVITDNNKVCNIRVAKLDPPQKLATAEVNALKSYINVIGNAGVKYNIISADPDRIEVVVDVYIDQQYVGVATTNVITAMQSYIANLDFSGQLYVAKMEDAIQSVQGVTDVKINAIYVRKATTAYASKETLFSLATGYNARVYVPYAGYIIEEDTASHTFTDTVTFY